MKARILFMGLLVSAAAHAVTEKDLSCQDKARKVSIELSVTDIDAEAHATGLGADVDLKGANAKGKIRRNDKAGLISAVVQQNGASIKVTGRNMYTQYCSGCGDGWSYNYLHVVATVTGPNGVVQRRGLTCSLNVGER